MRRRRGVRVGRREDVDIGRSTRGLKLCVVQSAATMSVSLYTRPHIPRRRCNTLQGRNNSVDSPLRIQAYSRGIRAYLVAGGDRDRKGRDEGRGRKGGEREISPDRPPDSLAVGALQSAWEFRTGAKLISRMSCRIECLGRAEYAFANMLRPRTLTQRPASFFVQSARGPYTHGPTNILRTRQPDRTASSSVIGRHVIVLTGDSRSRHSLSRRDVKQFGYISEETARAHLDG